MQEEMGEKSPKATTIPQQAGAEGVTVETKSQSTAQMVEGVLSALQTSANLNPDFGNIHLPGDVDLPKMNEALSSLRTEQQAASPTSAKDERLRAQLYFYAANRIGLDLTKLNFFQAEKEGGGGDGDEGEDDEDVEGVIAAETLAKRKREFLKAIEEVDAFVIGLSELNLNFDEFVQQMGWVKEEIVSSQSEIEQAIATDEASPSMDGQPSALDKLLNTNPNLKRAWEISKGLGCDVKGWGDSSWKNSDLGVFMRFLLNPTAGGVGGGIDSGLYGKELKDNQKKNASQYEMEVRSKPVQFANAMLETYEHPNYGLIAQGYKPPENVKAIYEQLNQKRHMFNNPDSIKGMEADLATIYQDLITNWLAKDPDKNGINSKHWYGFRALFAAKLFNNEESWLADDCQEYFKKDINKWQSLLPTPQQQQS